MRYFIPYLFVLFLLAAVLRIDFFFTIFYLFFAVYLLARWWMRHAAGHIHVERRFVKRAFNGDTLTVEVRVSNTGRLPLPWLHVHESLPVELVSPPLHEEVLSLAAAEQKSFSYTLYCRKRGVYQLGPLTAQTGDPLGLQTPSARELAPDTLIVYPRVIPLARLALPTHSPLAILPTTLPLFEDPARVVGVREYVRGDSPRRIHWTATASAGQLLVKQYRPAIARETLICLDLDQSAYDIRHLFDATELAITLAASLANHILIRERLPVGLITLAREATVDTVTQFFLPPRSERAHLIHLLETLARVQFGPTRPISQLLQLARPHLAWGTTLVVITGREDDALLDTCAQLRVAGFPLTLIFTHSAGERALTRQHAAAFGIRLHRVWNEKDIEAWR